MNIDDIQIETNQASVKQCQSGNSLIIQSLSIVIHETSTSLLHHNKSFRVIQGLQSKSLLKLMQISSQPRCINA